MHAKFVWLFSNDQMLNSTEKRQGLSTYLQFNFLLSKSAYKSSTALLKEYDLFLKAKEFHFNLIFVLLIFKCVY
jgi:hypothetical protein